MIILIPTYIPTDFFLTTDVKHAACSSLSRRTLRIMSGPIAVRGLTCVGSATKDLRVTLLYGTIVASIPVRSRTSARFAVLPSRRRLT